MKLTRVGGPQTQASSCSGQAHVVKGAYPELGLLFCRCGDDYHWLHIPPTGPLASGPSLLRGGRSAA
jgi:hypothetical protein